MVLSDFFRLFNPERLMKKEGPPLCRSSTFALLFLIFFAAALRLYFYVGLHFSDAPNYVEVALQMLRRGYTPMDYYPPANRMLYIVPLSIALKFMGVNENATTAYTFATSIASIPLAYMLGMLFFDRRTGLLAALLLAVHPVNIIYSTQVMAEVPLSFFMALSAYLFFKTRNPENVGYANMALSGVVLGLAYMVKEIAPILGILYMAYFISDTVRRKPITRYCYLLAGFLLAFSLEYFIFHAMEGDGLFRVRNTVAYFSNTSRDYSGSGASAIWGIYPKILLNIGGGSFSYGYGFWIALFSGLYSMGRRDRKAYPVILWLICTLCYLQAGTMNWTQYLTMEKHDRYIEMLSMPVILLAANFIATMLSAKTKAKYFGAVVLLALLIVSNISYVKKDVDGFRCGYRVNILMRYCDIKSISEYLLTHPKKPVYAEDGNTNLNVFLGNRRRVFNLRSFNYPNAIKDAYVIVNLTRKDVYGSSEYSWRGDVPKEWQFKAIIKNPNPDMPQGKRQNYPVIYYAP